MPSPRYPSLYQVNTRVWLKEISRKLGRAATLDDIPNAELDRFAKLGFDWIWFLSVWQTGSASQQISRTNATWRREFEETLPDLTDEDIPGSGFAITGYTTHRDLGGDEALTRLRDRLQARNLRLMLDFVPNHTGLDHPWVEEHPEYYIAGNDVDIQNAPQNYIRVKRLHSELVLAHGRDPYFPGWSDSLQLNYGNPATQHAMTSELKKIAGQCDGVRCDMAMLVLPEVFERTWGVSCQPFWPHAINCVRQLFPNFCFMAEVYWDMEWTLQQQGFDYTYDKRLYDRLREQHARPIREHFYAGLEFQDKLARFLENHDEPRAAATFPLNIHRAAAVVTFLAPGLRFFHQGQFEGRKKRISPHLGRAPQEPTDSALQQFYQQLLFVLRLPALRDGAWQQLECPTAWEGNWTNDSLLASAWTGANGERFIIIVNYADHQSQGHVRLPFSDLAEKTWRLQDQLQNFRFDWKGEDLAAKGLYVDMAPWQTYVFALKEQIS